MGPGVDPHLYKASEGDVIRMAQADIVFYNGLHLEGKMTEVFEQMSRRGIPTVAVAEQAVPDSLRLMSMTYTGNFDPHVWFDVKTVATGCQAHRTSAFRHGPLPGRILRSKGNDVLKRNGRT